MPEEICRNLYRIEVPLPESPLKSLNSYVIKGKDRNLVIDTGFNRKTCLVAMQTGLSALGIDLSRTDFFITHLHADHFGLVSRLATGTSQIFFSRPDAEIMESWEGFEPMIAFAGKNGFPENELRTAIEQHPGIRFGSDWMPALHILADGDRIDVGEYGFECVETPGHTLGHNCLYEPDQRLLIAGDHILGILHPIFNAGQTPKTLSGIIWIVSIRFGALQLIWFFRGTARCFPTVHKEFRNSKITMNSDLMKFRKFLRLIPLRPMRLLPE